MALHEIEDDFEGSFDTALWNPYTSTGSTVGIVSGELVLDHNFDGTVPGWPPPDSGVYTDQSPVASGQRVYCRFKPLLTDDNGAGDAHKAWDHFAIIRDSDGQEHGFGFIHSPADGGGDGSMFCKVFNHVSDEWWQDVGQISSYDADGAHAWLGLRRDGTNFYWDTAPDNGSGEPGTWTNRFSYSQTGSGVSFPSLANFLANASIHFRAYHWATEFSQAIVLRSTTIDGVNSPLVASVTHDATGVLTGPGALLAGAAARLTTHNSSGALAGPGAALAGSAAILRVHESDGALAGPGAVLAGQALIGLPVEHVAEGALAPTVDQGAILAGSASVTPDPDKTHSVQDAFDGGTLDAGWDHIEIGAPGGDVTVSGGDLRINQTSNVIGTGHMVRRTTTKDFAASYVYARLVNGMIVANNANGAEANFGVIDDTDSGYLWQQRSNGTLVPHWKVAGVANDGSAFAYTPSTHAWLRIKDDSSTIRWQHAPSTASNPPQEHEWITDHSRTRAADGSFSIAAMRVRFMTLMSFGSPGVPTGAVRFACVNMRTEQIVTHDATGDMVGDLGSVAGTAAKQANHDAEGALAGPGAVIAGAASSRFEHTAVGALVGEVGSAIIGQGSTSDLTRKLWVNTQDTGGAWNEPAQSEDPWTPRDDTGGGWAS